MDVLSNEFQCDTWVLAQEYPIPFLVDVVFYVFQSEMGIVTQLPEVPVTTWMGKFVANDIIHLVESIIRVYMGATS
jgi:hypothetical protein